MTDRDRPQRKRAKAKPAARRAVTQDRNFPRTGEGHRNVRPSVARDLARVRDRENDYERGA